MWHQHEYVEYIGAWSEMGNLKTRLGTASFLNSLDKR